MLAPLKQPGNHHDAALDVKAIKAEIDEWLYEQVDGVVQSGPFIGMRMLHQTAWRDTHLSPMLLGCYEEELHGEMERQITRLKALAKPKIGVIGSAEGYYAIGLKRRLPNADVFVVDCNQAALDICQEAAAANEVTLYQVELDFLIPNADLLVLDCEGGEVHYLDAERWPQLRQAHVVVELHNYPPTESQPALITDKILLDRFRGSHRINLILEGPRNPNQYKWLCAMTSDYRWLAVSESRPCLMGWYLMEPKGLYCP